MRYDIFDKIDENTRKLFSQCGSVDIRQAEILLNKQGYHVGVDINRESFCALVESLEWFLKEHIVPYN
jgi:hypothetical protein